MSRPEQLPAVDPALGITAPLGFAAAAACAPIRPVGRRLDVALLSSWPPAAAAGLFTQNLVQAAPVRWSRARVAAGRPIRAVLVNAGNANACSGAGAGAQVRASAQAAAVALGCRAQAVLVASTGVIGVPLPVARLLATLPILGRQQARGQAADRRAARAILTTDTRPKQGGVQVRVGRQLYTVAGMAKGAGMIHPDMATMLAFLTCDAPLTPAQADLLLRPAVAVSFNALSVDGDTSTNDCAVLLANGAAGGPPLAARGLAALAAAVRALCIALATAIAADGEGAKKLLRVHVLGAHSDADALRVARCIVASPLVKTAVAGGDPNWGRVLAAAGRAGVKLRPAALSLHLGGHLVAQAGQGVAAGEVAAARQMRGGTVEMTLRIGAGGGKATAFGCDLTTGYVRINSNYRT